MGFDVDLYHKSMNTVANILPRRILGTIGKFLFRTMMFYLKVYMSITHKTRERFMEYKWILGSINEGINCLNVGCGDSLLDYELSDRFRKYISIDLQKYAIAIINPTTEFVLGDITCAPFKNETFDVILCISTIEHIKNDIGAMEEMWRVLKHGGKIYVSVPLGPQFYNEESMGRLQLAGLQVETVKIVSLNWDNQKLCMIALIKESPSK